MVIAAAAGAVATGIKYLISEEQARPEQPSELLVAGMKKACMNEESIQKHLQSISAQSLRIPEDWARIT
jgi:hypothetical protein